MQALLSGGLILQIYRTMSLAYLTRQPHRMLLIAQDLLLIIQLTTLIIITLTLMIHNHRHNLLLHYHLSEDTRPILISWINISTPTLSFQISVKQLGQNCHSYPTLNDKI